MSQSFEETSTSIEGAGRLAYEHLRHQILTLALRGGDSINLDQIAQTLGVSRVPVRDAIRRLQAEGLVTALPNKRSVVTELSTADLAEVFEMRALLEGLAARHATPSLTATDLVELENMAAAMLRVTEVGAYLVKHEAFHDLVALRSGMPRLRRDLGRLREIVMPYMRIYGIVHESAEIAEQSHRKLIGELRKRKPAASEKAFLSHTRHAGQELQASVERVKQQARAVSSAPYEYEPIAKR